MAKKRNSTRRSNQQVFNSFNERAYKAQQVRAAKRQTPGQSLAAALQPLKDALKKSIKQQEETKWKT